MKADLVNDTNIPQWTPIAEPSGSNAAGPGSSFAPAGLSTDSEPPSSAFDSAAATTQSVGVAEAQSWQPAQTGPQGYAPAGRSFSEHGTNGETQQSFGSTVQPSNGGVNLWLPANQPGVLPVYPANAPTAHGAAFSTAAGESTKTEAVRHGGPFSAKAWRWSIAAVTAILGIIVLIEMVLSRLIDQYESGTTARLALVCVSLFTNDVVIVGVLIVALKCMGMSFRSMGLRRPADVKESIVLAFSAWLIFVLLAGVWALMSQSAAEREANNPLIRERTENSREASAPVFPSGSDARSSETPSAETNDTNTDGTSNESGNETTTTRTDQSRDAEKGDVADNRHVLIKVLNDDPPKALLISILIAGCIGAPLLEELLVRGLLFGAFSQRFGRLVGGAVSSLLFGFAHIMAYPIKMIPPLVVMGVVLAWLAWQAGSIVPGIFIHAFVNSIGLGMAASLGAHTFTLMVGSWLVLAILLLPWLRSKSLTGLASS